MELAITHAALPSNDSQRRAAIGLACVLVLGVTTQGLFWRTSLGLNFWVWDLLAVAVNVAVFRRGALRATAWGAIGACVLLGFAIVRYASDWTMAIAVPTSLVVLAALPIVLRDELTLEELAGLPSRMLRSVLATPVAVRRAARLPTDALGGPERSLLRGIGRGLLLGVPVAGLFTLLLSSDTDFFRVVARVEDKLGETALFVVCSILTSLGYLFSHGLHARPRDEVRTPAREDEGPYRARGDLDAGSAAPARLSVVTWAMVVGQVALVFGVFVAANLRHLFGGDALVRAPGALTYATYLHAGFAQLLVATILSVCLVLAGHALLGRGQSPEARSVTPGGLKLAALEAMLLALTGITVASCWQRLAIYEDAYGASRLRLGVAIVELAVLALLVLTLAKVCLRSWRGHGGAVVALFAALAVFASAINADAYVATVNLDRAARGKPLDAEYLASLSVDAAPSILDHPYVQRDPELAARLRESFASACTKKDLRALRGLGRCTGGR